MKTLKRLCVTKRLIFDFLYAFFLKKKYVLSIYIYILNVAALDETIIPSSMHFSMQNIEHSRGLGRASRWSNVNVNQ